jgi:hypothetical protein
MQITKSTSSMDFGVILKLSEKEARALEAITVYGTKEFLETFYTHLGKTYLQPHEEGVEILFETLKTELPKHLNKFDRIRKEWSKSV